MKGLVSLADQLDKVALTPEPEPKERTPAPMKQKVVSVPTRTPVNREAALIIARPPWWAKLEYDVPDRPPPVVTIEELRSAHHENAALARTIEELRRTNRKLMEDITKLRLQLLEERRVRTRIEQTVKEIL